MDEKLSFIPKKNLNYRPVVRRGGSGFVLFALLIFVVSSALWGSVYVYKKSLNDNATLLNETIKKEKSLLEESTINEVAIFAEKISVVKKLLDNHKSFSNVLSFLQDFTMKDIRFNDLSYSFAESGGPSLALSGVTRSYASLAVQIQALEKNNQVKKVSVSGLSSDVKGGVKFNLKIIIDPIMAVYTVK
ncbi:MAG: hypothetical protein AAB822_02280 [Patescibacteria group bacterium]